jgi:Nucleotidyl transferase AbiEii toxin, Type IV TA system
MSLPGELRRLLADETAVAWEGLAPVLPSSCRLAGGTALAVHLGHRESRDLDFFYSDPSLDLDSLAQTLRRRGPLAIVRRAPGTLNCQFESARVQFLHSAGQRDLAEALTIQGIPVLSLPDVYATKVKVIGDRGELRDYYDLEQIELLTGRPIEEGIGLYMARYDVAPEDASVAHIVESLGYLDDVDEDLQVPQSREALATYWRLRQREVLRNLSRRGAGSQPARPAAAGLPTPEGCTLNCHRSKLPSSECACACHGRYHGAGAE